MVIEWQKAGAPLGPPPSLRISPEEIEKLMIEAGFTKERGFDAGQWHYGIVFKK